MLFTNGARCRILAVVGLMMLYGSHAAAQSQATVSILNALPTIGAVNATDPVELERWQLVSVWCNATVEDRNGEKSITNVYSVLWNPAISEENSSDDLKSHYSPAQAIMQPVSIIGRNVSFEFLMGHNAAHGLWSCKIIIVDRHDDIAENVTNITVISPEPTCDDGYKNQNEASIDCGGECSPCECLNGVQDPNEEGIDCGGPCPICLKVPQKLIITAPKYVVRHENVSIDVTDDKGNKLYSLLRVSKPKKPLQIIRTDDDGHAQILADVTGIMHVVAVRRGYMPDEVRVIVVAKEVLTVAKGTSYVLPLIVIILVYRMKRRKKKKAGEDKKE